MKSKLYYIILLMLLISGTINAQFSDNPLDAVFETKDTKNFWMAFDAMQNSAENPFENYVKRGSPGVEGFIPYRIINADSLYLSVKSNKEEYRKSRNVLDGLSLKEKRLKAIYSSLKYWYPKAKFPPVYFVYGRFTSGGTVSKDGIIIGTEMIKNLDGITGLIAHELIHFQQNYTGTNNLLRQSLIEGSADFVSEFISGENINSKVFLYGNANSEKLCKEFVTRLKGDDYQDWLYGTSKKDDRPNDLGYWIGYKICEAYFNKQKDKQQAIYDILNVQNSFLFLKESGFLDAYIHQYSDEQKIKFDDFFKEYSDETFDVTVLVDVPNENDIIYITGNQPELGNWNPSAIKMSNKSSTKRTALLKIHLPAQIKFTKGNWEYEASVQNIEKGQNIIIKSITGKKVSYKINNWFKN